MKRPSLFNVWKSADRLLVLGIASLSLIWAITAVSRRNASKGEAAVSGVGFLAEADRDDSTALATATSATQRVVNVPQGAGWISYGGPSAARGDRRRQWSEQGVTRGEWLQAPAAPAVNIEQAADGYTVWCLLPDRGADEVDLKLAGDVLLVESRTGGPDQPPLRLRLPGAGPKRITGSAVSNGWLRIAVIAE